MDVIDNSNGNDYAIAYMHWQLHTQYHNILTSIFFAFIELNLHENEV